MKIRTLLAVGSILPLVIVLVSPCLFAAEPPKKDAKPAAVIEAAKFPNLQAAFDAVPEAGGLVKLPPGEFKLTEPLVLQRGDTRVVGAGAATKLINCNQEGKPALIIRPADLAKNPRSRLWRVQLANFRISGDPAAINNKSTKPTSGDGIQATNIDEIYIQGMTVDHCGGNGVNLINCYEDPRIADSIFTYNLLAGVNILGGHDIVVNANQFEENQDALRCLDGYNLCMNGNNIDDHIRHGVVIENTYGSVLSGNMIEECAGMAVILDRDCYGITISANVIADDFGGGVDLRDAWGCTVSANTFVIDPVLGVRVGPQSGRITITGNNFCDSFIGGKTKRVGKPNLATGIILAGTSDITISGNSFSGLDAQAIQADAKCKRLLITGNLIIDVKRGNAPRKPPLDVAKAKDSIVEHNIVTKQTDPTPAKK